MPKIRLFSTFLLSFLHFTEYFLSFSQSKTMNRMGGGLHQKRRFFADLPCTLLSTYTYPKIFNTSKIPQKHSNNTPKIHTTPTQYLSLTSIILTLPPTTHSNAPIYPYVTLPYNLCHYIIKPQIRKNMSSQTHKTKSRI